MTYTKSSSKAFLFCSAVLSIGVLSCADFNDTFEVRPEEGVFDFDGGVRGEFGVTSACTPAGATRCEQNAQQRCVGGKWVELKRCAENQVCSETLGCAACDPAMGGGCSGRYVYQCKPDGTLGARGQDCLGLSCAAGKCQTPVCAYGSKLIYVVDTDFQLLSFDPNKEVSPFNKIKDLKCPATTKPYEPWTGGATPFSMSIDRGARAWVLYTNGEIYWVDVTPTGACEKSPYVREQAGFKLFGMGFVADGPGSSHELLYVARARTAVEPAAALQVGTIDPATMKLTVKGTFDVQIDASPELTGTGNGEFLAYFPGEKASHVASVDKQTGKELKSWPMPKATGAISAWAFAHWGGKYYVFLTTDAGTPTTPKETNQVLRLDPKTGEVKFFVANSPYRVVGAGVSTCAPVID